MIIKINKIKKNKFFKFLNKNLKNEILTYSNVDYILYVDYTHKINETINLIYDLFKILNKILNNKNFVNINITDSDYDIEYFILIENFEKEYNLLLFKNNNKFYKHKK